MRAVNVPAVAPVIAADAQASPRRAAVGLAQSVVAVVFADGACLLDDGRRARRAYSCLVEPCAGDRVLIASDGADRGDAHVPQVLHVLHVLERRTHGDTAHLSAPGACELALRQNRVSVHAVESVALGSAGDVSLTAAAGTLSLAGRNLFATATDSIVEQAAHYVGRLGQFLLEARGLLRLHGEHALITAEHDVKVDAERISMG